MPLPSPTVARSASAGSVLVSLVTTARLTESEAAAGSELVTLAPASVAPAGPATEEKAVVWAPVMSLEAESQWQALCHLDKT